MRIALMVVVSVVGLVPVVAAEKPYRLIGIPGREHGYGQLESGVLGSQKQLDAMIKAVQTQQGWNNRAAFLKGLEAARVNFATEVLVLVRQTEGSGSNKVSFEAPEVKGEKLVCVIHREVPEFGTDDIADYCFALAVDRAKIKKVEVWVTQKGAPKSDRPRSVLTVPTP